MTCALCGELPATTATAAGTAAAAVSSTSCGAFAPDSLLAYFLRLVDVAFISKLYVPAVFTTDVTSTVVQLLVVKFAADPMRAPTSGLLV